MEAITTFIDTHTHLDGTEFDNDREAVVLRAKDAGVKAVFLPAIDVASSQKIISVCRQYPGYAYPMVGLHPEEVRSDYAQQLDQLYDMLKDDSHDDCKWIAIGEVGLDYYWSREFENEQLAAFERQVEWSIETRLPLMIHCRKAQNEMVHLLRRYEKELPGGVFHCFTGNDKEAAELLQFERFVLGVGGVLTFKKSHLPEVLPAAVPIDRIVLETDSPYMAPTPHRGERNESAFVALVLEKMAESYGVSKEEMALHTNKTVKRVFGIE